MHPREIWAIMRKDFLDIYLNKTTLVGLIYPIIIALMFLLISDLVGGSTSNLLIYNPDNSNIAQVVTGAFRNSKVVQASSVAEVEAAFGPNGTNKKSGYAVGLVVPQNFDRNLLTGNRPTVTLYFNGDSVNTQTETLLQKAITDYARGTVNPEPPVNVTLNTINPPKTENTGMVLGMIYTPMVLLLSLTVGTTFIPMLLLEEKEKKTLRMLLVSPASFLDILIGKLLVVLVFQLAITSVVLAIEGGFTGYITIVVLFIFLGAFFSLSLGLFFGSIFNTVTTAGTVGGLVSVVYILGGLFVGQMGQILGDGVVLQVAKILPTYYLADAVFNANQSLAVWSTYLVDASVAIGSTMILLGISVWALRRQSQVLAIV